MEKQKYKHFSARAVISAIVFSVGLWIYVTLNTSITTITPIPLIIKVPEHLAIETKLPPTISVKVRGDGWQLLNLLYFGSQNICSPDISKNFAKSDSIRLLRTDILNGIQLTNKIEVLDVTPDYLNIALGDVEEKTLQALPNIKIKTRDGFTLVGNIKIEPSEILVKGAKKALQNINALYTENIVINDAYKSFSRDVKINPDISAIIETKPNTVKISANIQQIAERTFYDIPVKITGQDASTYEVFPNIITIELRGGVDELLKYEQNSFSAKIDISEINDESNVLIKPTVSFSGSANLIKTEPNFLKIIHKNKDEKISKHEKNQQ